MPAPGVPNNPNGANSLGTDTPYGAIKAAMQQTRAVPLRPAPGVNAPKQASRAAQRPATASGVAPSTVPVEQGGPPQQLTYDAQLAATWNAIAATPGASPLVQQIAAGLNGGV